MAEAFAVSAVLLSAVQIASNVHNIMRACRDIDNPRVKLLKYRLLTQRELTIAWANRIREPGSQVWNIPTESRHDVEQILGEMKVYFERAERKMEKIYRAPDGKMTIKIFMQRFLFTTGGFQDIKDVTDALDEMNKVLQVIAPPLPPYEHGTNLNSPLQETTVPANDLEAANVLLSEPKIFQELEDRDTRIPISKLFNECLDATRVISNYTAVNHSFHQDVVRLKSWGCGILIEGPLSLDATFKDSFETYSELETMLVRILIQIAVLAGKAFSFGNE